MKVIITNEEIGALAGARAPAFPKYAGSIINMANRFSQATRPRVVGRMSELIREFKGRTLPEWEEWYSAKKPEAVRRATDMILSKIGEMKAAIDEIDREMVEAWVRDLVIVKTFTGLRLQEIILRKGAEILESEYRLSNPDEEAKGIDGYIGEVPVSIKPATYQGMDILAENIEAKVIFYKKTGTGVVVDYGAISE